MRIAARVSVLCLVSLLVPAAARAEPWVHRPMTLSRHDFALDLGLGVGHRPLPREDATGLGLNLELSAGIASMVELGVRTGLRFGRDGRASGADVYGRTFDTETYGTGGETVANPELRVLWGLVRRSIVELGLEGRLVLPAEEGTHLTVVFAVPVVFHMGGVARLDSGLYVPITFADDTWTAVSIPIHLWFQIGERTFLGPLTGVRFEEGDDTDVPLGFGIGHGLSYSVDLKAWLLFPDVSGDGSAKTFGLGLGLQVRF
jgi:hypothetical protein